MSTLYESGYNRNYYTETTGNWVAPSTCFKALVVIAGGGGGGGGGGGSGGNPTVGTAGTAGAAGGNTTFIGPNGISLSSTGGGAGTAGAVGPGTWGIGTGGGGGKNSGNVSQNYSGGRNQSPTPAGGIKSQSVTSVSGLTSFMETLLIPGGRGGDPGSYLFAPATAPATTAGGGLTDVSSPGMGVNSGTGGLPGGTATNGTVPGNVVSNGAGGGWGGNAIGEKYLCKITPGATYAITIGSGGAGGTGGNAGSGTSQSGGSGGAGGGGASGFAYILWNDVPQGT